MQLSSESVCALVFSRRGGRLEFLMLRRRHDRGGFWQSVSGRMELGETAEQAARREVAEETGLDVRSVIVLEKVNIFYSTAVEAIHLEPCFGVEVAGEEPVLSAEHEASRWVDYESARRLIPFAGVKEALDELWRRLARAPREEGPAES